MSDRLPADRALRSAAILCCIVGAGCATVERGPTTVPPAEPAVTAAPAATTAPPAAVPVTPATPGAAEPVQATPPTVAAPGPGTSTSTSPKPTGSAKPAPAAAPAKPPVTVAVSPPAPAQAQAQAPAAAPKPAAPKPAPAKPAAPPLDLAALEVRLRETRAIGVMTKLSLKNQVDDLLDKFRAYYKRQAKTSLAELRRPYDMLLLKVLSLLQDSDPPLARDIVASREAIWGILADPKKFNEAKLMAGDTP